jgi:hypothetical protein
MTSLYLPRRACSGSRRGVWSFFRICRVDRPPRLRFGAGRSSRSFASASIRRRYRFRGGCHIRRTFLPRPIRSGAARADEGCLDRMVALRCSLSWLAVVWCGSFKTWIDMHVRFGKAAEAARRGRSLAQDFKVCRFHAAASAKACANSSRFAITTGVSWGASRALTASRRNLFSK